jgi:hypothetical protein
MSLSATVTIHAAPNAISMVTRAATATAHDLLDSMDEIVGSNISKKSGLPTLWQAAENLTTYGGGGSALLLHCAKMRAEPTYGNFLLGPPEISKLTRRSRSIAFTAVSALCAVPAKPI